MSIADTAHFVTVATSKVSGAVAATPPRTGATAARIRCHAQRLTTRQVDRTLAAGHPACALARHPDRHPHDILQPDDAAPHRPDRSWAASLPVICHVNRLGSRLAHQLPASSPNAREKAADQ